MYTGESYEQRTALPQYTATMEDQWSQLPVIPEVSISIPTGIMQKAASHNLLLRLAELIAGLALLAIGVTALTGRGKRG